MALNFNGMMQGIGAGLTTWGGLLAEQSKRDWEEKMMNAKMDREEHLQTLKINADKDLKQMELDQSTYQWNNLSAAQKAQNNIATEQNSISRLKAENEASYQTGMLGVARQNAASQQTSADAQMLNAQKDSPTVEVYNLQMKEREKNIKIMEDNNVPEQYINYYRFTGALPTGKETPQELINTAYKSGVDSYESLPTAEKLRLETKSKVKSATDYGLLVVQKVQGEVGGGGGVLGLLGGNKQPATKEDPTKGLTSDEKQLYTLISTPGLETTLSKKLEQMINKQGQDSALETFQRVESLTGKKANIDVSKLLLNNKQQDTSNEDWPKPIILP